MKTVFRGILTLLLLGLARVISSAQGAESYFHRAANSFINSQNAEARQTLQAGLQRYPADPKMRALLKEIKDNEQKKQPEKEQQQQKEQQQKEQQKKEQQQKEQQDQAKKEPPPPETRAEGEEKQPEERQATREKLKEMNLTEEKARMILDAMKTNEIQYLQQRRKEKSQRPDKNKPDW